MNKLDITDAADIIDITAYGVDSSNDLVVNSSITDFGFEGINIDPSIKIEGGDLEVNNGDIKIDNLSLRDFMNKIEQRLEILRPNIEIEDRWQELKELGDRYRKLECEILEKEKMWGTLRT